MAWTSPDGVTWEQHAVPQPSLLEEYRKGFPGEDPRLDLNLAGMGPLARLGDSLFSFGRFSGDNDFHRPLGWRSADGTEWESIESANAFFGQCCGVVDLVTGDPGLLAIKMNFGHYEGELWLWTAETSWVQTWPMKSPEPGNRPGAEIRDAVWGDEKFVAVGLAASLDPATPFGWRTWASSWVSTDGRSWQAAPPSGDREESAMYAVSPLPSGGFVAVGCQRCTPEDELGTPATWMSPDGLTWTPVALPADFEGAAYGVLQLGSGLLAVGAAPDGTATWTSADGKSWQAGPILDNASHGPFVSFQSQIHNVVARADEVVFLLYRGHDEFGVPLESVLLRGVVEP